MESERIESNYLDFELQIDPGKGREYPVSVIKSPAGEAREVMKFPFDELALENRLLALQNALLRSGGNRRHIQLPEEKTVQDFGKDMFSALISGEVRSRFAVSQERAVMQGKGLRIKFRIQSPELAALPWEFMFDEGRGEYLCLSRNTPIVRYVELPQTIKPLKVKRPLRILVMIAAPSDLASLDVEREKQRIEKAVASLQEEGMLELTWLPGQTWRDLQRAMRRGPWHIFHFIGHGGFDAECDEGLICLSNEDGKKQFISASQLGRLLADHGSLRFVLLNSCEGARGGNRDIFSSSASILVQRGIPAVLAMQYEITDRAAVEFARTFYESLAEGLPIDTSTAEARKAVSLAVNNTLEWGTPVLYMRSPDGLLFLLEREHELKKKPAKRPGTLDQVEGKYPPSISIEKDRPPIKDRENLTPKEPSLGKKLITPAEKQVHTKKVTPPQELFTPQKPPPGKDVSDSISRRPVSKHGKTFKRLSLIFICGIIISLIAYLVFKPGSSKGLKIPAESGKREAEIRGEVKKDQDMPPDVLAVKNKGYEVSKNDKGYWEADFEESIRMIYIPPGEFTMGSDDEEYGDYAKPAHKVYLDGYWIGRYEVTVGQFERFVNDTGYQTEAEKNDGAYVLVDDKWQKKRDANWKNPYFSQNDDYPVVCVSWSDAQAYIKWLSEKTGLDFNLPTEAQWERAARGSDERRYPWGKSDIDGAKANFADKIRIPILVGVINL